jgi:Mg/Co/Ni transporter MgtE
VNAIVRKSGARDMAWTIARVAGIDIRIHVTFLLLLAWFALVSAAMQRHFARAALGDSLDDVWRALKDGDEHLVPVLDGDRLVGLVDVENLIELARIRSALERRAG